VALPFTYRHKKEKHTNNPRKEKEDIREKMSDEE